MIKHEQDETKEHTLLWGNIPSSRKRRCQVSKMSILLGIVNFN